MKRQSELAIASKGQVNPETPHLFKELFGMLIIWLQLFSVLQGHLKLEPLKLLSKYYLAASEEILIHKEALIPIKHPPKKEFLS